MRASSVRCVSAGGCFGVQHESTHPLLLLQQQRWRLLLLSSKAWALLTGAVRSVVVTAAQRPLSHQLLRQC